MGTAGPHTAAGTFSITLVTGPIWMVWERVRSAEEEKARFEAEYVRSKSPLAIPVTPLRAKWRWSAGYRERCRSAIIRPMSQHGWNLEALRVHLRAYPPYAGAGVLVTHIAEDASEIRVEMPLTDQNVNLVGTHFGGSLYSMVDPHLMILLIQRLGHEYVVWDREATIRFRKPGVGAVHATICVTDEEIDVIRSAAANGEKHLPRWTLEILDEHDEVVATVVKTLYVRRRRKS